MLGLGFSQFISLTPRFAMASMFGVGICWLPSAAPKVTAHNTCGNASVRCCARHSLEAAIGKALGVHSALTERHVVEAEIIADDEDDVGRLAGVDNNKRGAERGTDRVGDHCNAHSSAQGSGGGDEAVSATYVRVQQAC